MKIEINREQNGERESYIGNHIIKKKELENRIDE